MPSRPKTSLLDEADKIQASPARSKCRLARAIAAKPKAMQAEIEALIGSDHPATVVAQVLTNNGIDTSTSTIVGHRNGVCKTCSKAKPS